MANSTVAQVNTQAKAQIYDAVDQLIEGSVSLFPNCDYRAKTVRGYKGLGQIFNGLYYSRKMTHTINDSGYNVTGDVVMMEGVISVVEHSRLEQVPTPAPKAPDGNYRYYKIVWGDTLWDLARTYKTTVALLVTINKVKNPDLIFAGRTLKIPM